MGEDDNESGLLLIRGLPGSGKSTLAKATGWPHVETDMWFMDRGEYKFDARYLQTAHAWCLDSAELLLERHGRVVVSNTFTTRKEMQPYVDLALRLGCNLRVIEAKGDFGDVHNVPKEIIDRMRDRWETIECTDGQNG